MSKLKNQLKKDLTSNLDVSLKFDTEKLESNTKKNISLRKALLFISLILIGVLLIPFVPYLLTLSFSSSESIKHYNQNYTANQIKLIESSSFKKLNEIEYPDESKTTYPVSTQYRDAIIRFSEKIYDSIDKTENSKNFSFSPIGLYSTLTMLSLATDNPNVLSTLDNLIGLTQETRKDDFINMMNSNYFITDTGTLQMYNASFQSNKYEANPQYIDKLTQHHIEAYQLDLENKTDVNKMLGWLNQRTNSSNYLTKDQLDIDSTVLIYWFSTLYFKNKWYNDFMTSDTYKDYFYTENGCAKTNFMKHSYYGKVYEYEDYISCYDYYSNGLSIKYIVPQENVLSDLFSWDVNLFHDNEENLVKNDNSSPLIVNLSVPKFKSSSLIDFSKTLKDLGLSSLFDVESKNFNYIFNNVDENIGVYLKFVKQKNQISFDETGTKIKSVSVSAGVSKGTYYPSSRETIDVKLNKPFIYIIYDNNSLPIYVGHVTNPK